MRLLVRCSFQLQSKDECFFKNYGIQTIFYAFQTRPGHKTIVGTLAIFHKLCGRRVVKLGTRTPQSELDEEVTHK